jgi:hypothetical protein
MDMSDDDLQELQCYIPRDDSIEHLLSILRGSGCKIEELEGKIIISKEGVDSVTVSTSNELLLEHNLRNVMRGLPQITE